jgi:hypothetical protein
MTADDPDYFPRPGSSWRGLNRILQEAAGDTDAHDRLDPSEVDEANALMRHIGARTRYRPDGSHYRLQPGEEDPAAPQDPCAGGAS